MSSKTNKPVWSFEESMAEYAAQTSQTDADYARVLQNLKDAAKSGILSKEKGNDDGE